MQLQRHEWEHGWFTMASDAPHASLHGIVRGAYCGWTEYAEYPVPRRELASTIVPLIINFGPRYRLTAGPSSNATSPSAPVQRHSFVAGVHDTWVSVESARESCALQVNMTPLGAHLVLQSPMHTLAGCTYEVADVLGASARLLAEQLGNLSTWPERFAVVDAFLRARVARATRAPAAVQWVWQQLCAQRGNVPIAALTRETGYSPKRLIAAFREHVGLPPKQVARLLRFEHLVARLDDPSQVTWSTRALDSGYFDQAHMTRDFTAFAGCTPTAYLRERAWFGSTPASP